MKNAKRSVSYNAKAVGISVSRQLSLQLNYYLFCIAVPVPLLAVRYFTVTKHAST